MADGTVPAGWYPDSQLPNTLRWWDGTAWTTHTAPVEPTATPTSATPETIVQAQSSAAPTPTLAQGPAAEPRHRGGLFGRKKAAAVEEPLKKVVVRIESDDGSFNTSNDDEIVVHGYRVFAPDGQLLEHSDLGEVTEGIFYFRLAGATHHRAADELDGDAFSQVLLRHRPDNPHDPNAIEILNQHGMEVVGFVPAKLAPKMIPGLMTITDHGETTTGTMGIVVKTFQRGGRVIGGEIISGVHGYEIQITK
jgi:hypothetical protein